MAGEITLKDVFNRVETYGKCVVDIKVSLAVLAQKVKDLPTPPVQPCSGLINHLEGHKTIRVMWQRPIVAAAIQIVVMILMGVFCFLAGRGG